MTPAEIDQMFSLNGIEWSTDPEDVTLSIGPTYSNAELARRVEEGHYRDSDTPEEMYGRVRAERDRYFQGSPEYNGYDEVLKVLEIDGILGLKPEHKAWIPPAETYAQRRSKLEQKVSEGLSNIRESVTDEVAKELDNDFEALMDEGGTNDKPTTRKSLLSKMMVWMGFGADEHVQLDSEGRPVQRTR